MADGRERTSEEREAARRERERRRAGLPPEPDLPPPPRHEPEHFVDVEDEPFAEPPPGPGEPYAPDGHAPDGHARDGYEPQAHEPEPHEPEPHGDDGYDEDGYDQEHERPSGTRRVSRLTAPLPHRPRRSGKSGGSRAGRPGNRSAGRGGARPGPRRSERSHPWLGRIMALIGLAIAAVVAWFAVQLFQPFGTSPHGEVVVVVPAHSGARQVGDLLAREGVIPSGFYFELRATLSGQRGQLRAGTYHLQLGMSYSAVLAALTKAPPVAKTSPLTISEGHPRAYVSHLLARQGIKGNYLRATLHSPLLNPAAYGAPRDTPSLEGFLFPDTFNLVDPIQVSALVADQLRDFKQRFATVNLSYARSKHLTPYDVLKIASMIEAEAASQRDRSLISSVIYNRLHDGMMLQFDSTTRYATGNFTGALTESQLRSRSPYNTHTHLGLPPTPIDSPGLAAIEAAAHPAHTDYLFFFTKPCNAGGSVYTHTYSEFQHLLAVDKRTHCPG